MFSDDLLLLALHMSDKIETIADFTSSRIGKQLTVLVNL